ncbi:MAG TPA: three-Cys-motif partner protein TcmP [Thermoanaerobaculia bacterium]|jgi:three-Cys-motif partner protein|nr:three-Cys-motif partner protein TcmP [Thermoanaerobaculia bacterium]
MAGKKKKPTKAGETTHDEIGFWSEIKLDILRKYSPEYTKIIHQQQWNFHTVYVDAFAGSGQHVSRTTGTMIAGSPARALEVQPPFDEYHFVDLDAAKIRSLEELAAKRNDVHIHHGDCNEVLLEKVFPHALYENYRRALCLLDPYSLQLDWRVIARAAEMKSVEIFLNFPIMDINRNVLRDGASPAKITQMTRFWGNESWRSAAFTPMPTLFGDVEETKVTNWELANAFRDRLRNVAGFTEVSEPLAMKNSQRATVYYLFFAGQNVTGRRIVDWIFNDYREKGYG